MPKLLFLLLILIDFFTLRSAMNCPIGSVVCADDDYDMHLKFCACCSYPYSNYTDAVCILCRNNAILRLDTLNNKCVPDQVANG